MAVDGNPKKQILKFLLKNGKNARINESDSHLVVHLLGLTLTDCSVTVTLNQTNLSLVNNVNTYHNMKFISYTP